MIEHGIGAGRQWRIDEKPGHSKFVARHGVNCRKTMAGFCAFWQDRASSARPFRRLPDAFRLL
jgi:hypothetical protein